MVNIGFFMIMTINLVNLVSPSRIPQIKIPLLSLASKNQDSSLSLIRTFTSFSF